MTQIHHLSDLSDDSVADTPQLWHNVPQNSKMDRCTISTCPARQRPGVERRPTTPSPCGRNTITEMLQNELKKKECLLKSLIDDYESLRFKYCSTKQEFKSFKEVYRQLELDNGKLIMEKKQCMDCQEGIVVALRSELEQWKAQYKNLQDKIPTNGDVKRRIENIENMILSQSKILSEIYQHDTESRRLPGSRSAGTFMDPEEETKQKKKTFATSTTTSYVTAEKSTECNELIEKVAKLETENRNLTQQLQKSLQSPRTQIGIQTDKKKGSSMIPLRTDKPTSMTNHPEFQDSKWESIAKSTQEENKTLTLQIQSLKQELKQANELEQQNIVLRNELMKLTDENTDRITSLQRKITQLQDQDDARKEALEIACRDLDRIKKMVHGEPGLEEDFARLTQSLRRLTTEVDLDRESARRLKTDMGRKVKSDVITKEKSPGASVDLQNINTIKDLQEQLTRKQRLITELEGCVDQTNGILDECEGTIRDLTKENARLRAEKEDTEKKWREKYNDLIKINENLLEELENLEAVEQTVHFLTEQFTMLLEQIQQMSGVISALGNTTVSENKETKQASQARKTTNPTNISSNPKITKETHRTGAEKSERTLISNLSTMKPTESALTPSIHYSVEFIDETPRDQQFNFSQKQDSRIYSPESSAALIRNIASTQNRPSDTETKRETPAQIRSSTRNRPKSAEITKETSTRIRNPPSTQNRPSSAGTKKDTSAPIRNPPSTQNRPSSAGTKKDTSAPIRNPPSTQNPPSTARTRNETSARISKTTQNRPSSAEIEKEVNVIHLDHSFANKSSVNQSQHRSERHRPARSISDVTIHSDVSTGSEVERCICTGMLMCTMKCHKCKIRYRQLTGAESFDPETVTLQDDCKIPAPRSKTAHIHHMENIRNDVTTILTDNNKILTETLGLITKIIDRLKNMHSKDPEVQSVQQEVVKSLMQLEMVLSKQSKYTQASTKHCKCCDCMDVINEKFCQDSLCRNRRIL